MGGAAEKKQPRTPIPIGLFMPLWNQQYDVYPSIIIYGTAVITGSLNFSKAAEEKNAENLLIIKSSELAKKYIENWNNHKGHSEVYEPRY